MKAIFVDTSGWMMMADRSDRRYAAALAFRDAWLAGGGAFVTTDYVADETLTLIRTRLGLDAAERWWDAVDDNPRVRWEAIDASRSARARTWLFRWREHDFSFTDCTSFVLMRELRLERALTSDRHFAVAGFEIAPGSPRR
jgi:predicted nucleic acid-binding protein